VAKKIKLELSPEELIVLTTLVENQFFRMRFIDPRLPGYTIDPEVYRAAQSAVAVLSEKSKKVRGFPIKPDAVSNN
jgi:hypothetical protein